MTVEYERISVRDGNACVTTRLFYQIQAWKARAGSIFDRFETELVKIPHNERSVTNVRR